MNQPKGYRLSKASRLLKKDDFRFDGFSRYRSQSFTFIYTRKGKGRIGISISKKVLKNAVARNRVRRLLREAFRLNQRRSPSLDLHVVGLSSLKVAWKKLDLQAIQVELDSFLDKIGGSG